jgi:hypothetical protein
MHVPIVSPLLRRAGMAAILAGAVASEACFFFDDSVLPIIRHYRAHAVVRNAAGLEVGVTEMDDLFAAEMFVLALDAKAYSATEQDALVRSRFSRALARRLTAGGDGVLAARFGAGPWCLVGEPSVVSYAEAPEEPPDETGAELPPCVGPPPPVECANPGEEPALEVVPPGHSFGDVPQGTEAERTLTVRNVGTGVVCLGSIVATGRDPYDFPIDDSDCRPEDPSQPRRLMAEGDSCELRVRFGSERPGPSTASLRISSNVEGIFSEFPLSGRALPGTLSPLTPVCLPRDADGCYRRTVSLTNTGPGAVTLRGNRVDPAVWRHDCSTDYGTIDDGDTLICTMENCGPVQRGTWFIPSDAFSEDGTLRMFEIPLIPRVNPGDCTP